MAVLGGLVGGGLVGAVVRDAWIVGIGMTVIYGLTVWRGLAYVRRAKAAWALGARRAISSTLSVAATARS